MKLKYHHLGIPTDAAREGETYLEQFRLYTSGYDTSPYKIEWMRFEPSCPLPELVKTVPHVAFEVDDLLGAIAGEQILIAPNSPSPGVTVAFIVHNGAPVELLQIDKPLQTDNPASPKKGLTGNGIDIKISSIESYFNERVGPKWQALLLPGSVTLWGGWLTLPINTPLH